MVCFEMLILCVSAFIILFFFNICEGSSRPRIAIIGGGVGGTTAAYKLTNLAAEHGLDIHLDLYESNQVGGRLATKFFSGFEFEIGGSIIHNENKYMGQFVEKFNLSKYHKPDSDSVDFAGFYDGRQFVYVQSRYEVLSLIKFWWRYGLDLITMGRQLIDPLLTHFKRVYELQTDKETFDDVHGFLAALDPSCLPLLLTSIKDLLFAQGYSAAFVNEFVFLATNVNYNQNINIHGFVGAVALAGAQEALWSVQGGNKQIPEALLAHSDANFIAKRVQTVVLMPNSKYALYVDENAHIYDYVIIACPIIENTAKNIKFEGFSKPVTTPVKYQRTVATLVHGELNHTYFHYTSEQDLPNHIYSVNHELFFSCICVIYPVAPHSSYDKKVFKIFSTEELTNDQLDLLFLKWTNVSVVDWLAYPQYDTSEKNLTFVLNDNLFYVNAIEWAASAMEMSAIAGVNTALHVFRRLKGDL